MASKGNDETSLVEMEMVTRSSLLLQAIEIVRGVADNEPLADDGYGAHRCVWCFGVEQNHGSDCFYLRAKQLIAAWQALGFDSKGEKQHG